MAVKVPAHSRLYSEIDEASGHYRRYDQSDLECLAERCGLQVSFLRRMNVAGAFVYRLRRKQRTNFSRTFSATQLKAINATLPVIRAADWIPCLPGLRLARSFSQSTKYAGRAQLGVWSKRVPCGFVKLRGGDARRHLAPRPNGLLCPPRTAPYS